MKVKWQCVGGFAYKASNKKKGFEVLIHFDPEVVVVIVKVWRGKSRVEKRFESPESLDWLRKDVLDRAEAELEATLDDFEGSTAPVFGRRFV